MNWVFLQDANDPHPPCSLLHFRNNYFLAIYPELVLYCWPLYMAENHKNDPGCCEQL